MATSALSPASASTFNKDGSPGIMLNTGCRIGSLLPQTGNLAFLYPPMITGLELAVKQINEADGIRGVRLEHLYADSSDNFAPRDIAPLNADGHLANNVMAIVGAASSSVTLNVIDKVTRANVVLFSPSNTSPALTTYPSRGFYFRTAPPDDFQGAILAKQVLDDGKSKVAVLALDDRYGKGLSAAFATNYRKSGGRLSKNIKYNADSGSFRNQVTEIKKAKPTAIVLIGYEETTEILREMISQGIGPQQVAVYLVDGNLSTRAYQDLPRGVMKGVKGTLPGAGAVPSFVNQLRQIRPSLQDVSYAPETWDAVNLIALAAERGGSCDGQTVKANLAAVSGSNGGEKCTSFASCKELLKAGKSIDYEGQSGSINFDQFGNPSEASMGIYVYRDNQKYELLKYITGSVPKP